MQKKGAGCDHRKKRFGNSWNLRDIGRSIRLQRQTIPIFGWVVIPIPAFYSLKPIGYDGIPVGSMESPAMTRLVGLIVYGVDDS